MRTAAVATASIAGHHYSDLVEVSHDPARLESAGRWVVVVPYDGEAVFARFATVTRAFETGGETRETWPGVPRSAWTSSLSRSEYLAAVGAVRDEIARGGVYQVNLTRVLSAPWPDGADIVALGRWLASRHPAPHAATVRLPEQGVHIASASPELFLRRDRSTLTSSPIKGTAADVTGLSPKDTAENVMIVDLVRNDLSRVCRPGSVTVTELCGVHRHPGLVHLVSTVTGELLPGVGWPQVLAALHPAGSVTGAPKLAACDLIAALEPQARGPYCGAIGWVDADRGTGELNVAIRTFWRDGDRLRFGTGGAVTWGSDPTAEWRETELKADRLLAVAAAAAGDR